MPTIQLKNMIKKEKALYKDGRKNPNGYKNNPFDIFEKKWIPIALSVLIPMALVVSVLEAFNVTSWNKIFSSVGIIDGTQVADENFVVYCLDVCQSDCTVIVCDDTVMMIDTGTSNQVYNIRTSLYTLGVFSSVTESHYSIIFFKPSKSFIRIAPLLSSISSSDANCFNILATTSLAELTSFAMASCVI